ncbi:HindVP family restriction endonuclease [Collinsella stercoris]|nr:HindVP family restriction endonuclease [Collinsella stercoris]UEA45463.1 HindVP family restriction endonuclease [Collinsella stercoris DSM 13279]UWP12012.1 HindVP family restriction endonuclease [Collinsella stercoris]
MANTYLYGLEHANHRFDGSDPKAFGKNIFTNAFPLALIVYMDDLGYGPMYIEAAADSSNRLHTTQSETPLHQLLNCNAHDVEWLFESSFDKYRHFSNGLPARSDVVIRDINSNRQLGALEIKLVTIPNSATAHRAKDQQSCEIVVRPPSIEQLCFSIANTYGPKRRHELGDIISSHLSFPMDYEWKNETFMLKHLQCVISAAEEIALKGIPSQAPFALTAIWRTKGQASILDTECFDAFVWSDMAFVQLFIDAARRNDKPPISRPSRSLIWLIKALFDYSAQGIVTFEKTRSEITYGAQTDKAGSFSGESLSPFLQGNTFLHPRIPDVDYSKIVDPSGIDLLKPERRLDGALVSAKTLGSYISISQ